MALHMEQPENKIRHDDIVPGLEKEIPILALYDESIDGCFDQAALLTSVAVGIACLARRAGRFLSSPG